MGYEKWELSSTLMLWMLRFSFETGVYFELLGNLGKREWKFGELTNLFVPHWLHLVVVNNKYVIGHERSIQDPHQLVWSKCRGFRSYIRRFVVRDRSLFPGDVRHVEIHFGEHDPVVQHLLWTVVPIVVGFPTKAICVKTAVCWELFVRLYVC